MLAAVGIPRPRERFRDYPHQYSGGMRQRAMIAMALLHNPDVLIADEPTTALDVTVQAQILELIDRIKTEFRIGVILITHDLGGHRGRRPDGDGHVRGARDGARRRATSSSASRSTRTPGACSSRFRRSPRRARGSCRSRARRPRSSTCRPAARSIRAVRTASRRATTTGRTSRIAAAGTPRRATSRSRTSAGSGPSARRAGRRWRYDDRRRSRDRVPSRPRRTRSALVSVRGLTKHFPITRGIIFQREIGGRARGRGRLASTSTPARRSGSSASPARASRRPPASSRSSSSRPPGRSSSTARTSRASAAARCGRCGARCRSSSRTRTRR